MGEWSLVVFTLFMQGAIGAYIISALLKRKYNGANFNINNIVTLSLSIVALIVSLLHLGTPIKAMNSLLNLGSSWLSREIFFTAAFVALLVISFVLEKANSDLKTPIGWLTVLAGVGSVFSMAFVYINSVIPAWASWNTILEFVVSTVILGVIIFALTSRKELGEAKPRFDLVILFVVLTQLGLQTYFLVGLGVDSQAGQLSLSLLFEKYGLTMVARWILVLIGTFLMVYSGAKKSQKPSLVYTAAIALLVSQVIGRYIFYAVGVAISIGLI